MKNWKSTYLIYKYFQPRLLRSKRDRRTQTTALGKCSVRGGRGLRVAEWSSNVTGSVDWDDDTYSRKPVL